MKNSDSIRIVVADDHAFVREGLIAILNRVPDVEVVGQASNWPAAIKEVIHQRPEIAVMDLHMRGMEPVEGVATLREKFPAAQVIIFSAFGTDEEVYQVLCAGARGYVLKGESGREDLLTCIRAVARGEIWIHPIAAARLAERMTAPTLTERELEVLRLMAVGKSNKEIGSSLDVTEGTVKVHVNHILAKLGVAGRVEAIMVAVQRGFVHLMESLHAPAAGRGVHENESRVNDPHPTGRNLAKAAGAGNAPSRLHIKK